MNRHNNPQCKGRSVRQYTLALIQSLLMVVALSPAQASVPDSQHKLLQMTSAGYVLGFDDDGVYFVSGNHMLKVGFEKTNGVRPIRRESAGNDSVGQLAEEVAYSAVWPGVDLVYDMATNGIVESTWKIAQGADPDQIRLRYNRPVSIEKSGELKVDFETGWMSESAPVAWQEIDGRHVAVQVAFKKVDPVDSKSLIGFELGQYDPLYPLLIDPLVNWHTYMGSGNNDFPMDIALDDSGNIYVLGISYDSWGNPINPHAGGRDVFVAKLSSDGTRLWNTFMGAPADGEFDDWASALAVDVSGNVYVTGSSFSSWGTPAADYSHNGDSDAFVVKLATNGARLWNVFLGASATDGGTGIAVDGSGNVYVTGVSWDSWMISAETLLIPHSGGATDVFVAKLDTNGVLQWNTFMGAGYEDESSSLAIDAVGNIYVTGYSLGTWGDPLVPFTAGDADIFVAKLNNAGLGVWHTFMGSASLDVSEDIAVDGSGNVYVTGRSFATWGTPVNLFTAPNQNAFAVQLDSSGTLQWNTFMSGTVGSGGQSLATDNSGNVYVVGNSSGDTWGTPVIVTGDNPTYVGQAFVVKLDAAAGTEQWNAFLGGGFSDNGNGVAVDGSGDIYVTGSSIWSWGTPVNAYVGPNHEVFVARICNNCFTVDTLAPVGEGSLTPESSVVLAGETTTFDVTAEPGYTVDTVTGCSGSWTGANPYTTGSVTQDCTVTATFSANVYTVSTSSVPAEGGTFNPSSMGVTHGNVTAFDITAEPGYTIDTVTGCDGGWTGTNPYTTGLVIADCTVTATFIADVVYDYTVSTSSVPVEGGTFNPLSIGVNANDVAILDIVANSGYTVDMVTGCSGSWTGSNPYTTGAITADCTVTATFAVVYDYTISTSSVPAAGGTFNPSSMGIDAGYAAILEITPNTGYALISATGCDGTLIMGTNPATYEINWASADCTVTATFSDNSHRVSTAAPSGHAWFWPEFQDVIDGEVASFEVDPEPGYTIDTVTGCGGIWTGTPYVTGPITENCTITATIVGENSKSSWLLFLPAITGGRR